MKTKNLVKDALAHPERWSWAELAFFQKWLESRKERKAKKKEEKKKNDRTSP